MAILKRAGLGLWFPLALSCTALTLGCMRERSDGSPATATATGRRPSQDAGKAPPLPKLGPLAEPRSLQHVGLPAKLTRAAIPADNLQTPDKIALG